MSLPPEPMEDEPTERVVIDRALKALAPCFHAELAAWLVGERPLKVEALEPGLATLAERARDKLLRLEFAARPAMRMHLELQLEGRADVPRRLAEYLAMEVRAEPPPDLHEPLACVVVYLDEARYRHDPGFFEYEGALGTRLRADYRVVKLWEVEPQEILGLEHPGLCVLAPFLRGDKQTLCVESRQRIQSSTLPEGLKRDLLTVLSILAARKIADRGFLQRFLLETKDMTGNYVIDYYLKQGEDRGAEKGRVEGAQAEARRMLLRVLARRFGPVPDDLRASIEAIESLERLESLHDEAVTCQDLEGFRGLLSG